MKTLIIDPRIAGIAGDMMVAALVDLTGSETPVATVAEAIRRLPACRRFDASVRQVESGGIGARQLDIHIDENRLSHPEDLLNAIHTVAEAVGLSKKRRGLAICITEDLIRAETRVHRSHVHLHEVGSLDTVFDVTGTLLILEKSGFLDGPIYGMPPKLGNAVISMAHGNIASPAPATLEILCRHQLPFAESHENMELTTPTGAAILANITHKILDSYPAMTPIRTGYGAGQKQLPHGPNVLRLVEGRTGAPDHDRVVMLQTNLDDTTGEILGYTLTRLIEEGAVDVWIENAIGKKNRPVQILTALCQWSDYPHLSRVIMEQTGTLGLRVIEAGKIMARRETRTCTVRIEGQTHEVRIKVSTAGERRLHAKPEFDDIRAIAERHGLPPRQVAEAVMRQTDSDLK